MEERYRKKIRKYSKIAIALSVSLSFLTGCGSKTNYLILNNESVEVELGKEVSKNIEDYINKDKIKEDDLKKIIKGAKETDNLKNVKKQNYPKVGEYKINFEYKDEKATVKVIVKDTTKPEITAPDSIDVVQYTNLADFDFDSLLSAKDYSKLDKWKIDTSKVDVNTIGTYDLKVTIQDKYKNKASKKLKVNIVQAPEFAEGEVAVTEVVTDENGNKKTVVTKKASDQVSKTDAVASTSPVSNKGTVNNSSSESTTKPSSNSGTSKPSTGNSSSSSNNNTGSSSSSSSKGDEHKHNYNIPVTKTVHHDAVTRQETYTVVDKEAYDEPVYETHVVCKVCGQDFGKGEAASDQAGIHSAEFGHSYHSTKVQAGTKHHDAVTHQETRTVTVTPAYDETVTTGYRCSCGAVK